MTPFKKLILLVTILTSSLSFAGEPCCSKKCTGSEYCSACKNCSGCAHCNSGGYCGVCRPEAYKKAPVKKKPAVPAQKKKPVKSSVKTSVKKR